MATATTAKKVTAKKPVAKKPVAKKAAPKKAVAKKAAAPSFKKVAEKAVNVYLGVIGKGVDAIQENMETARKENDKRVKDLEKRGVKLRKELEKRVDKFETPKFDNAVEDAKEQFAKVQDQVEEVVENVKEKLTPAKAA